MTYQNQKVLQKYTNKKKKKTCKNSRRGGWEVLLTTEILVTFLSDAESLIKRDELSKTRQQALNGVAFAKPFLIKLT